MGTVVILALAVVGVLVLINLVGSIVNVLIGVVIWAISGWLASRVMGGDGAGLIGNILLGIVGGVIGSILLRILGLGWVGSIYLVGDILVGVVGAVVAIFVVRAITRNQDFAR